MAKTKEQAIVKHEILHMIKKELIFLMNEDLKYVFFGIMTSLKILRALWKVSV